MVVVVYLGPGQYRVEGLGETQYVDLNGSPCCHCGDFLWRKEPKGLPCKHLRAVFEHQKEGR